MGVEYLFGALLLLAKLLIAGLWTLTRANTQQIQHVQQELMRHKAEAVSREELNETFRRLERKLDELFKDVHTRNH